MPKPNTPLTFEMFEEALLPRIEEIMDEKIEKYRVEVLGFKEEVLGFKVEVLGEIKKLREEVSVVNHQYQRTNQRVDKIEKLLPL